jgi:hypothetical protein
MIGIYDSNDKSDELFCTSIKSAYRDAGAAFLSNTGHCFEEPTDGETIGTMPP